MRKSGSVGFVSQPARVQGVGGPAASTSNRVSLYGAGSATKRSMTPSSLGAAKQRPSLRPYSVADVSKDPRPNNKPFIFQCINELLEFLLAYNFPHPLSQKQLMQPSSTDFKNIFEFLVSFLKPNYKMGKNIEVVAPKRLKQYGYPFSIPKSHFQTIGVPHTWPTIVLALTWLRISIQGSMSRDFETMMFPQNENEIGKEGRKKLLFDYTNESYDLFMKGTDDFDDLRTIYEKKIDDDSQIDLEIEALTRERDQNRLTNEKLFSEPDNLINLEQNLMTMQLEIEKFEKYQFTLESHLKELAATLHLLSEEEKDDIVKLEALECEKERKMQIVGSQLQLGVDFQQLMAKVSGLRRQVANREHEISDRKTSIQKLEAEISQDYEKVNAIITDFNRIRRELMPECDDLDLTVNVKDSEKIRVMFHVREWKTKLTEQMESLDENLTREKGKTEMLEEFLNESERTRAALMSSMEEKNDQLNLLKVKHQQKLNEIDSLMDTIKAQQGIKMSDISEANRFLQKEELAFVDLEANCQKEEREYREFLGQAILVVLEHKKMMQEFVRKIDMELMEKCDEILQSISDE